MNQVVHLLSVLHSPNTSFYGGLNNHEHKTHADLSRWVYQSGRTTPEGTSRRRPVFHQTAMETRQRLEKTPAVWLIALAHDWLCAPSVAAGGVGCTRGDRLYSRADSALDPRLTNYRRFGQNDSAARGELVWH